MCLFYCLATHYGEDMEIPDNVIEKYIKIRKLSQGGVSGERDMALRIMQKMQREYPNIEHTANAWETMNGDGFMQDEESEEEREHWSDVYRNQQKQKKQWDTAFSEWGEKVSNAFSWATDFASNAFGTLGARNMALDNSMSTLSMRLNPTGSLSVSVNIKQQALDHLVRMSDEQRAVFCNTIAQRISNELYEYTNT